METTKVASRLHNLRVAVSLLLQGHVSTVKHFVTWLKPQLSATKADTDYSGAETEGTRGRGAAVLDPVTPQQFAQLTHLPNTAFCFRGDGGNM